SLCEARLLEGLTDEEVRALFATTREADYRALSTELRAFAHEKLPPRARNLSDQVRARTGAAVARFRKRLGELAEIDFFGARGRESGEGLLVGHGQQRYSPSHARDD